jgi:hypothetical protein
VTLNPETDYLDLDGLPIEKGERKRVLHNERSQRERLRKLFRAGKIMFVGGVLQWRKTKEISKRAGIALNEKLGTMGGQSTCTTSKPSPEKQSPTNSFSQCKQCGKQFTVTVDGKEKSINAAFPFCGETLYTGSPCKTAWLVSHPPVLNDLPYEPVSELTTGLRRQHKRVIRMKQKDYLPRPRKK